MRRIVFYTIAFTLFLSFFAPSAHALLPGFNSKCLNGEQDPIKYGYHAAIMKVVTGKEPIADTETYIFMCVNGGACTAPTSDKDNDLNLKLFGQTAKGGAGKTVINKENPTRSNANGTGFVHDPIVITNDPCGKKEDDCGEYTHRFWWVQSANTGIPFPTAKPDEILVDDGVGNDGGLKLASIGFEDPTPAPQAVGGSGTKNNCNTVSWDPRGYLFDAETLNPVRDITITLFKKQEDKSYIQVPQGIGLTNPLTTSNTSGQFNFFVSPGLYKMTVNQGNATIAQKDAINPEYQQLFSDQMGNPNIYEEDADILEVEGRVAVAHIPVTITDKRLIIDSLHLLIKDSQVNTESKGTQMHITGTVSHPKSTVTITSSYIDTQGNLGTLPPQITSTNELGEYDLYVNQEPIGPNNTKVYLQNINIKLELNAFYAKNSSNPAPVTYDVKPIPMYLDGIAYNSNQKVIPNAIVGIYPFFSQKPMHMVIADQNGRFRIGSQNIPEADYFLKYLLPSGEVVVTEPTSFIRQNISLYTRENIQPYAFKQLSQKEVAKMNAKVDKTITKEVLDTIEKSSHKQGGRYVGGSANENRNIKNTDAAKSKNNSGSNSLIVILTIILTVLIGVAVAVMIAIKMKR